MELRAADADPWCCPLLESLEILTNDRSWRIEQQDLVSTEFDGLWIAALGDGLTSSAADWVCEALAAEIPSPQPPRRKVEITLQLDGAAEGAASLLYLLETVP